MKNECMPNKEYISQHDWAYIGAWPSLWESHYKPKALHFMLSCVHHSALHSALSLYSTHVNPSYISLSARWNVVCILNIENMINVDVSIYLDHVLYCNTSISFVSISVKPSQCLGIITTSCWKYKRRTMEWFPRN